MELRVVSARHICGMALLRLPRLAAVCCVLTLALLLQPMACQNHGLSLAPVHSVVEYRCTSRCSSALDANFKRVTSTQGYPMSHIRA